MSPSTLPDRCVKLASGNQKTGALTRVAIIEDHALVRQLVVKLLEDAPSVELSGAFGSIEQGVAECLKLRPTLVIVDWLLPDGCGVDVVRALGSQLKTTRFLILSSVEKAYVVRQAIDLGVHGFVMKREPYEVLLEAIRTIATGRSYYCPTSSQLLIESLRQTATDSAPQLTSRERDILRAISRGEPIKVVAARLGLSPKTLNNQLSFLKGKLGIFDTVNLARYAEQHGLGDDL